VRSKKTDGEPAQSNTRTCKQIQPLSRIKNGHGIHGIRPAGKKKVHSENENFFTKFNEI